jgi:cytidine deaminase
MAARQKRDALAREIPPAMLGAMKQGAVEAANRAYAPYSRFAVGAAVLSDDGRIHTGANVENASFGLSICAERNAIFRAVAEGVRRIEAIVVYTPTANATPPCGACRQVLAEFGADALIICCSDGAADRRYHLAELLPETFGPQHL